MRNLKPGILTIAFVVVTIIATGQRAFADQTPRVLDGPDLRMFFNNYFGTDFKNNGELFDSHPQLLSDDTGIFKLDGAQVFPIIGQYNATANFSVNGVNPPGNLGNFNFYNYFPSLADLLHSGTAFIGEGDGNFTLTTTPVWSSPCNTNGIRDDHFIFFDVTEYLPASYTGYTATFIGYDDVFEFPYRGSYNFGYFLVLTRDGDAPAGVPEPATMFLWTLGGLSLAGASRRRNRNKKKLLA